MKNRLLTVLNRSLPIAELATLLTRSERGMSLITPTESMITQRKLEVADVTGAGDTLFQLAVMFHQMPASQVEIANVAAGIAVTDERHGVSRGAIHQANRVSGKNR